MAIYGLRNTASLEILSIVEYDGSSSYDYLSDLGLELYSGSLIEEFTAQEHTPYDLYDPIHGLHITSEVGSVLKGLNFITGSVNLIGNMYSTGSQYLEGKSTIIGSLNISGSLNLDGEKFEEVFKTAPKPCTVLKYEEDVINQLPTDGGLNPQGAYFIFDIDTSINGDYGENSWLVQKPTKIRLNLQTLGDTSQQNEYETKLFDIIRGRLGGSTIELTQILSDNLISQAAYKKFEIIRGIYRERSRRKDVNGSYPVKYHYLDWGAIEFVQTDRFTGQEDIDYFAGDGPWGLDFNQIGGSENARDGFFEFEVKQIEPLNINPSIKPQQDDLFSVCISRIRKRREVTVFTGSGEYSVPEWCDTITMFAVGAGGGGGGGAWGYPMESVFTEGFELAVGGGGGAGGSVAKSVYRYSDLPGIKLNVFVGSPGKGGVGLDNTFPYENADWIASNGGNVKLIHSGHQNFPNNIFGKKGGDSMVYSSGNRLLVKAEGGNGGNPGLALKRAVDYRSNYTQLTEPRLRYALFHDGFCSKMTEELDYFTNLANIHTLDSVLLKTGISGFIAIGGGGSTKNSFGTEFVRPGGAGGYGTHTIPHLPYVKDKAWHISNKDKIDKVPYIVRGSEDINTAPNIPASNVYNPYLNYYDEKKPMGRISNNFSNKLELFEGTLSSEKNLTSLSPPGGGGGFGVRMMELDDRVNATRNLIDSGLDGSFDTVWSAYRDLNGGRKTGELHMNENGYITSAYKNPRGNVFRLKKSDIKVSPQDIVGSLADNNILVDFVKINNATSPGSKNLDLAFITNTVVKDEIFSEIANYNLANSATNVIPQPGEIAFEYYNGKDGTSENDTIIVKINIVDADGINRENQILRVLDNILYSIGIRIHEIIPNNDIKNGFSGKFKQNDKVSMLFQPLRLIDKVVPKNPRPNWTLISRKVNDYYEFDINNHTQEGLVYTPRYGFFILDSLTPSDDVFIGNFNNQVDTNKVGVVEASGFRSKQYSFGSFYSSIENFVKDLININGGKQVKVEFLSKSYSDTELAPYPNILTTVEQKYFKQGFIKTIVLSTPYRSISGVDRRVYAIYETSGVYRIETEVIDQNTIQKRLVIPVKEVFCIASDGSTGLDPNINYSYSTYDLINDRVELDRIDIRMSTIPWLETDIEPNVKSGNSFLSITPFDGAHRFERASLYAYIYGLGKGGKVMINNVLVYDIGKDNNGYPINLTIGSGGYGGFGEYYSVGRQVRLGYGYFPTEPENVSNRWGVGGGGGAATFLKKYSDKNNIGQPGIPSKGQNGADGGPGIVVIIAETSDSVID